MLGTSRYCAGCGKSGWPCECGVPTKTLTRVLLVALAGEALLFLAALILLCAL